MKYTIAILVALLLASNAFWLNREMNQNVTQMYQNQERFEVASRSIATAIMASEAVKDKPKEAVKMFLTKLFPEEQIFEKDGALHTAWLTLPFTPQGVVTGVAFDSLALDQVKSRASAVVGNEVFWK